MLSATADFAPGIIDPEEATPHEWRVLGRLEKGAIGTRGRGGVTTVRRREAPGCVLFGPYWQLSSGDYRLNFRCRSGKPRLPSEPVLGVEIIAMNRVQLAWVDVTATELDHEMRSVDFSVPPELGLGGGDEARLEFRFFHMGNADLTIEAVDLRSLRSDEVTPAPARMWRMLGRLEESIIARRTALGIAVPRWARAGCLLDGGRPFLQLPAGSYRLGFRCDVGTPRTAARPVLRVEITARRRWQDGDRGRWYPLPRRPQSGGIPLIRRDFTAEELCSGAGSIDVTVPRELSLEGGGEVVLGLRFMHLGNASLIIRAIDLLEIGRADGGNVLPLPALVAPHRTNVLIIGNCQAQTVYEALLRTSEFNSRLNANYHFVGLQQNLHELGRQELESSDILLVQEIRDWENYPLRQYIPEKVEIVKFPLLHFASLWPFDHYNGPGDKEAYEREWPNLTFLYHDGLLARLRREIPDREQRFLAYRSLSVDGLINFGRLHDFEKRRLTAMDKQFGLQIGEFILDNFRRRRLFYTTNHPNGQIIAILMEYLLRHLGVDQVYRPIASLDHLRRLQVPVHPKVAHALGVTWATENTKYLYNGEQITWETYTRRYIEHYG
jgi:hypothetical protein